MSSSTPILSGSFSFFCRCFDAGGAVPPEFADALFPHVLFCSCCTPSPNGAERESSSPLALCNTLLNLSWSGYSEKRLTILSVKSALFTRRPQSSSSLSKELLILAESLGSFSIGDVEHSTIGNLPGFESKKITTRGISRQTSPIPASTLVERIPGAYTVDCGHWLAVVEPHLLCAI